MTITSFDQLVPCEDCKGYGDIHAGTRFAEYCGKCDGTGWMDGTTHVCPHCGENVKPVDNHMVYSRSVWHIDCIKKAMQDPNASDLLIARMDLCALVPAVSSVRKWCESFPMDPMLPLEKKRHADHLLKIEAELAAITVKLSAILRRMDPEGDI